eukprot:359790-Pleurochrysis_carterae.AAC.3
MRCGTTGMQRLGPSLHEGGRKVQSEGLRFLQCYLSPRTGLDVRVQPAWPLRPVSTQRSALDSTATTVVRGHRVCAHATEASFGACGGKEA